MPAGVGPTCYPIGVPLHSKLDMVIADLLETFSTTSLANLIEDPNWPTPLCSKQKARLYTLS